MDDEHGIYDRPPEEERPKSDGVPYNALRDERPRMWRTFALFLLLMFSLLAIQTTDTSPSSCMSRMK